MFEADKLVKQNVLESPDQDNLVGVFVESMFRKVAMGGVLEKVNHVSGKLKNPNNPETNIFEGVWSNSRHPDHRRVWKGGPEQHLMPPLPGIPGIR